MFGLIGMTLSHSFSKEIHESISTINYNLIELDQLDLFFKNKKFIGVNVTIPYKEDVIPYLDELSQTAKEIGVVNTVINSNGVLKGFNTDYYGLKKMLDYNNVSLSNKNIVILGNGSTSKTISYLCETQNAKNIYVLARNPKQNEFKFKVFEDLKDIHIVFNATPVGMYPNNYQPPLISLNNNSDIEVVVDVVYNPLNTRLLLEAKQHNIKAINGLHMLIEQAIKANTLFTNKTHDSNLGVSLYTSLNKKMSNFVFIGMPMSGKSFLSEVIAKLYDKNWIEIDDLIEEQTNISIPDIFKTLGETEFRHIESDIISTYAKQNNQAISCGGGVVLNDTNMHKLKQNGLIIFLDVPLSLLKKANPKNRPLLKDKSNLEKLYNDRYELYKHYADIQINKNSYNEKAILSRIEAKIDEYFSA
ncbi:MAG: shikimate dehydrogenase [Candidatus Izimaplasma sp.]|nr:shikimate dehydrogenase [Candidatus Izimaplasma bacterium]